MDGDWARIRRVVELHPPQEGKEWGWVRGDAVVRPDQELEVLDLPRGQFGANLVYL